MLSNQVHVAGYLNRAAVAMDSADRRVHAPGPFSIDAIHHHYAMLLGLHNAGLVAPGVYGVADNGESRFWCSVPAACLWNAISIP